MRRLLLLALPIGASAYGGGGLPVPKTTPSTASGSSASGSSGRRTALARISSAVTTLATRPCFGAEITQSQGVLEARSLENSLAPPAYGMEGTDIFYPPGFKGSWGVQSKTTDIYAPCGFELFTGGKAGYDSAVRTEVRDGGALEYRARFCLQDGGDDTGGTYVAADREFNAREIARAAMGEFSVVDTPVATPNRYSCVLAPPGGSSSSSLICVDILAIARRSEEASSSGKFVCSEFVRQIVSPARRANPNAPPRPPLSAKEIETISIYNAVGGDRIECRQRTATFLVPSQTDPIAFKKWQLSQGRPVDVRYYDLTFTRLV